MSAVEKIETKYSLDVMDHFNRPRNVGSMADGKGVGTGIVGAPACGDVLKLQIKVDSNGRIEDAKFKAFGCGSAIASSSLATDIVKGMSIDDSFRNLNSRIADKLSLPPIKLHCSMLARDAIESAINDYKSKSRLSSS